MKDLNRHFIEDFACVIFYTYRCYKLGQALDVLSIGKWQ